MQAAAERDGAAVSLRDVRKAYGHGGSAVTALDGISTEFARRTFTAVMGQSGSGKSTHCCTAPQAWTGRPREPFSSATPTSAVCRRRR
ncbi:MAG TPA: hypothetical protein VGJ38_03825 [Jatrophihabitantaceae bacterium]